MLKKYPAATLITILSFVLGIGETFSDLFLNTHAHNVVLVQQLLNPLNLDWIFSDKMGRYNGHNYTCAIFDVLLLLGAILYIASQNKQSGLTRFVFSMIFLSNILSFVYSLIFFAFIKSPLSMSSRDVLIDAGFYSLQAFWIYVSYQVLKFLRQGKALQTEISELDEAPGTYFVAASVWQRIVHPFIDTFVTIVLFSPILHAIKYWSLRSRLQYSVSETQVMIIFILLRVLYYLFYENVLGTTPAKLITGTRVTDYDGNKPPFKNILVRTFSRLVPFEAFSFFTRDGWHDKWSETMVVKEQNKA